MIPLCADLIDRLGAQTALEYALTGGDDYCLLASIPSTAQVPPGGRRIGLVVQPENESIFLDGKPLPESWELGWDHSR
jgi:thiamine monophosphate kinase